MAIDNYHHLYVFGYNVLSVNIFSHNLLDAKAFVMLQSGKSAAVYACAQEQGFNVLEVYNYLKVYF